MDFSWQDIGIIIAILAAMTYLSIFWIRNKRKESGCSNCDCAKRRPDHIPR
ncbi:MAG TPA: hypothetical protein PLF13_11850 [candidate division Zixibacteria bacterium]|nr:hypothetical protein [candidate division Zixibacteria bacterium]